MMICVYALSIYLSLNKNTALSEDGITSDESPEAVCDSYRFRQAWLSRDWTNSDRFELECVEEREMERETHIIVSGR